MEMVASAPAQMGPRDIADWADRAERLGFDTIHVSETIHDPFTVAAFALQRTERLIVRTSMVVAFPRSPMITACAAWDLVGYSSGRFQLGVASQVRGNIVGRFSTQWSEPVERLADYIKALRAIFDSFQSGEPLDYNGSHYRFDRLQPYFNPGPLNDPPPQIWTGGVNRRMCVMAGELADGFVCHPTNSHPEILAAQTLPALTEGAARVSRDRCVALIANPQPVMAATGKALVALRESRRAELAFLYSTPAYRRQLEFFGLDSIGADLTAKAKRNEWSHLSEHFTDEAMNRIVPQGVYADIPDILGEWYAGSCSGISLSLPDSDDNDAEFAELVERCKKIPARRPNGFRG